MKTTTTQIVECLDKIDTQKAETLPVLFCGINGPYCIGHAKTSDQVDAIMEVQGLISVYISLGKVDIDPKQRRFFICHR